MITIKTDVQKVPQTVQKKEQLCKKILRQCVDGSFYPIVDKFPQQNLPVLHHKQQTPGGTDV